MPRSLPSSRKRMSRRRKRKSRRRKKRRRRKRRRSRKRRRGRKRRRRKRRRRMKKRRRRKRRKRRLATIQISQWAQEERYSGWAVEGNLRFGRVEEVLQQQRRGGEHCLGSGPPAHACNLAGRYDHRVGTTTLCLSWLYPPIDFLKFPARMCVHSDLLLKT